MFPLPILTYVKLGAAVALLLGTFYFGWHTRDVDYMAFKAKVTAEAEKQISENASKDKQALLITQGVKNEYEAKLSNLRNFYGSGLHVNPSGGKTTGISPTPSGTDASAAYSVLVGQCAETTQQLVSLQYWLNQQLDLK